MSNLEMLSRAIHEKSEELNLDFSYILDQLLQSILESVDDGT